MNIIYIITDQQRYDTINALGYPFMETPNIDKLVKEGCTFSNCFAAGLSCAPSRASIFNCYYPHTTGIIRNACSWKHSWIELLLEKGYHTVNIGKMHTWPFNTTCGFKERYNVENKDRFLEGRYYFDEWDKALASHGLVKQQRSSYRTREDYGTSLGAFDWELPEKMHADMFVGDMAVWWIKNHPVSQPLFLQIGFPGPHPPYDPLPSFSSRYLSKDLPINDVSTAELEALPPPLKVYRKHCTEVDHDSILDQLFPTKQQRFRQRAYYLANITMIDQKIGEILKALEEQGYLDDAVIVFTSDHGDCLGDHGLSQKWSGYDQVVRVPAIVWKPGMIKAGQEVNGLCQQFDISQTLLEMAEIQIPASFESESVMEGLLGKSQLGREYVFAEQGGDGNLTDAQMVTMIRSAKWKMIHYAGEKFGQLFDVEKDPLEAKNLWDDSSYDSEKRSLQEALLDWHIQSQYRTRDWVSDYR